MRGEPYSPGKSTDPAGLTAGKIEAASTALTAITVLMETIWRLVTSAGQPGADRPAIDEKLVSVQSDIMAAARDANFNGGTWFRPAMARSSVPAAGAGDLDEDDAPGIPRAPLLLTYVSVDPDDDVSPGESALGDAGTAAPAGTSGSGMLDGLYSLSNPLAAEQNILVFSTREASDSDLLSMTQAVVDALSGLATARTFLNYLADTIEEDEDHHFVFAALVGSLVNKDMDENATRIVALETQQQLCVQSLSIANDNANVIQKLFG